jgi:hypothetical protein
MDSSTNNQTGAPRPKLQRDADIRQEARDFYANSTEQQKMEHVNKNIYQSYDVICETEGSIVGGEVKENRVWMVREKDYRFRFYNTMFIIVYLAKGQQARFSWEDYGKLDAFLTEKYEDCCLYVEGSVLKGHCSTEENTRLLNELLLSIYSVDSEMRWLQCFYY